MTFEILAIISQLCSAPNGDSAYMATTWKVKCQAQLIKCYRTKAAGSETLADCVSIL